MQRRKALKVDPLDTLIYSFHHLICFMTQSQSNMYYSFFFQMEQVKMGREVDRWDPPNRDVSKDRIPLWGATSKKVPGNEAVGPIFNVKRENDFAANELKADPLTQVKPQPGNKIIAYPCYPVDDKKHGFTGVGTPQSPCDVGGMPMTQYGPTYGFSDGKNGFVPQPPRDVGGLPPVMVGPVFPGVGTGSGTFFPMPLPKVEEFVMFGPVIPIPDHYSKYTPQPFGCSGYGINADRPKELHGPGNRDVGDRNAAIIAPGKYVPEHVEKPEVPKQMMGPTYLK